MHAGASRQWPASVGKGHWNSCAGGRRLDLIFRSRSSTRRGARRAVHARRRQRHARLDPSARRLTTCARQRTLHRHDRSHTNLVAEVDQREEGCDAIAKALRIAPSMPSACPHHEQALRDDVGGVAGLVFLAKGIGDGAFGVPGSGGRAGRWLGRGLAVQLERRSRWIPAFAGMTSVGSFRREDGRWVFRRDDERWIFRRDDERWVG
jgi:hypothetical protein